MMSLTIATITGGTTCTMGIAKRTGAGAGAGAAPVPQAPRGPVVIVAVPATVLPAVLETVHPTVHPAVPETVHPTVLPAAPETDLPTQVVEAARVRRMTMAMMNKSV